MCLLLLFCSLTVTVSFSVWKRATHNIIQNFLFYVLHEKKKVVQVWDNIVNDDRIFHFGWIISLMHYFLCSLEHICWTVTGSSRHNIHAWRQITFISAWNSLTHSASCLCFIQFRNNCVCAFGSSYYDLGSFAAPCTPPGDSSLVFASHSSTLSDFLSFLCKFWFINPCVSSPPQKIIFLWVCSEPFLLFFHISGDFIFSCLSFRY